MSTDGKNGTSLKKTHTHEKGSSTDLLEPIQYVPSLEHLNVQLETELPHRMRDPPHHALNDTSVTPVAFTRYDPARGTAKFVHAHTDVQR